MRFVALLMLLACGCQEEARAGSVPETSPVTRRAPRVGERPQAETVRPLREGRFLVFRNVEGHGLRPRDVRVHLPANYDRETERYPILLVLDGQNAWDGGFDLGKSFDAFALAGSIDDHVIIAIPSSSEDRVRELTPWDPAHCPRNDDACSEQHHDITSQSTLRFIFDDVLPLVGRHARILTDREHVSLLGFSYGGLAAVYMMMHAQDRISRFVVCSPSVWWQHRVALDDLNRYRGRMPDRVAIHVGEHESEDSHNAALLVEEVTALSDALTRRGMVADQNLMFTVSPTGAHNVHDVGLRIGPSILFVLRRPHIVQISTRGDGFGLRSVGS